MSRRLRHFSKKGIQMANRLMKRYSSQLIIRETQINTKIIYYLTPARMAIIKQTKNLQTINAGENFLLVQWLGLCTYTAGGTVSIPGQRTKILQARQCAKFFLKICAREGMEKREPPYTVGGNVNWYSQFMELWKLWKTIWKVL